MDNKTNTESAVAIKKVSLWQMVDGANEMVRLVRGSTEFGAIGTPSTKLAW